jgi:large subunit ribosomal protein L32
MSVRMRHTSSHSKNRRSHHALAGATIITDKESGNLRLPHRLDEATGMYRGIQIVSKKELKAVEDKKEKKAAHKREHIHTEGVNEPVQSQKHLAEEKSEAQSQGLQDKTAIARPRARQSKSK